MCYRVTFEDTWVPSDLLKGHGHVLEDFLKKLSNVSNTFSEC